MKGISVAVLAGAALSLTLLSTSATAGCAGCSSMKSSSAAASISAPEVGQRAPAFNLPSTTGRDISLAQYRGKKTVVLYFYPKDETAGCTKEACDFRDHTAALEKAGVVILGVSTDDLKSHSAFRRKEHIPYPLLSDTDARVSKMYGVYGDHDYDGRKWSGITRTTFVIDKSGKIAQVWPNVNVDGHVEDVLAFLSRQQQSGT